MYVIRKISVLITKKINYLVFFNLRLFLFRPILNPWPSQRMPFFVEICLPSKIEDMLKTKSSEISTKNYFGSVMIGTLEETKVLHELMVRV